MADKATTQPPPTSQEVTPDPTTSHQNPRPSSSQAPTSLPHQRPGESIMKFQDPSTEALRQWAADKEKQYPGADGSIAVTAQSFDFMAWRGAHIVPRKGDTLPPPDEKMRHGEVEYVGPAEGGVLGGDAGTREGVGEHEGGKKEKKDRLGGLFYRKEKEHYGEEGSVVG